MRLARVFVFHCFEAVTLGFTFRHAESSPKGNPPTPDLSPSKTVGEQTVDDRAISMHTCSTGEACPP